MAQPPTESTTTTPAAFATPGTLIAVGVWACLFTLFIVLGLLS